jgi:hypothetical protein
MMINNQSVIIETLQTKSLLSSLYKREEFPSLVKRGWGRFSEQYVHSIRLKIGSKTPPLPSAGED